MAKVIERRIDKAQAAEVLRDVPILELILRAATAGVPREEIKHLLLLSAQEVEGCLDGKETAHRFGLHRK
jgi:hypothetical protein